MCDQMRNLRTKKIKNRVGVERNLKTTPKPKPHGGQFCVDTLHRLLFSSHEKMALSDQGQH